MADAFFPYHPLKLRVALGLGALAALALTAWAVWGAVRGGGLSELARAGLSGGLLAAMVTVLLRLRPRAGWGVSVKPTVLVISRPTKGEIEIPWSAVREVRRLGPQRDTLAVMTGEHERVLVPGHLFAAPAQFEAVVRAIEARLPPTPYDA